MKATGGSEWSFQIMFFFCGCAAERHGHVTGALSWEPGKRHYREHTARHCAPAPPCHDGPQRQQHQAHHAENWRSSALPWSKLPAKKIDRLYPGYHRLCLPGTPVPHGKTIFCSYFVPFSLDLLTRFLFMSFCSFSVFVFLLFFCLCVCLNSCIPPSRQNRKQWL